jgi:carboxyl-terminal processing protease
VTGGGGIQPDIRADPAVPTQLETVLDASGAITAFATQYLSKHPNLPGGFAITPDVIDDFQVFLSSRRIQPSIAEWTQERAWVTSRLKEEIVTQARGVDKGDEIAARRDPQIQAALRGMQGDAMLAGNKTH